MVDPLGNEIYFKPGTGKYDGIVEDWDTYALHFIAGFQKEVEDAEESRTIGLKYIDRVITDPFAIIIQNDRIDEKTGKLKKGRKLYLALFKDEHELLNQVVVGIEESESGRVVTGFVRKAEKGNKNSAFNGLKNHIKNAKEILFIKDRQSGHPLRSTGDEASTVDANLHSTSQFILPQFYNIVKENVDNGKLLQQSSDTLMQSAGVNADTANMELLQKALNMYNSGLKDAEEIYAETGWHIGFSTL